MTENDYGIELWNFCNWDEIFDFISLIGQNSSTELVRGTNISSETNDRFTKVDI